MLYMNKFTEIYQSYYSELNFEKVNNEIIKSNKTNEVTKRERGKGLYPSLVWYDTQGLPRFTPCQMHESTQYNSRVYRND